MKHDENLGREECPACIAERRKTLSGKSVPNVGIRHGHRSTYQLMWHVDVNGKHVASFQSKQLAEACLAAFAKAA